MSNTPSENDPAASRGLWPVFLDGDGAIHDVFPWDAGYAHHRQLVRAARTYDCGIKYGYIVHDINKDGLDEVILFNRQRLWVFHSPDAEDRK